MNLKGLLASILSWVKAHTKTAAIGAVVILIVFLGLRACRVGPAEVRADKAEAAAALAAKNEATAKHDYAIAKEMWVTQKKELDKTIEKAGETIAILSGQVDSSNFTLAELQKILDNAKGFEAKYYAQVPIIAEYKKRDTLYWPGLIAEKDKIILAQKVEIAGEHKLRLDAEAGWDLCKIALEKEQKESRAKDGVISRLKLKNAFTLGGGLLASGLGFVLGTVLGK